MKIECNLPDKIKLSETRVIRDEERQGVKKKLEAAYRKELNRTYRPLQIPICCEYCHFVGERMWHCHNQSSLKNGINVTPGNVCSKWQPNSGLLMYLHRRFINSQSPLF